MDPIQNISSQGNSNLNAGDTTKNSKAITGLVLGILSQVAWFIPLTGFVGFPVAIFGIIFGIRGRKSFRKKIAIFGLVLSIGGLIGSVYNIGIYTYYSTQNNIQNMTEGINKHLLGPYSCNDKELKIEFVSDVNKLEGVRSKSGLVLFYSDFKFEPLNNFTNEIYKKVGFNVGEDFQKYVKTKIGKDGEWGREYQSLIEGTQKGYDLSSGKVVASWGIFDTESIDWTLLGTTEKVSDKDMEDFINCYNNNESKIYSDLYKLWKKEIIDPIVFYKVFTININSL